MITKSLTVTTLGLKAQLIEVEVDLSPALPGIVIVGLPDKAVQESKERIRASIKQSGYEFPLGKIVVNLAPADVIKTGSGFDLPIALGILRLIGVLKKEFDNKALFIGELSLDGGLRAVNGVLTICLWAKKNGFKEIYLPSANSSEASLVKGIKIYQASSLSEIVNHLNQVEVLKPLDPLNLEELSNKEYRITLGNQTEDSTGLLPNDFAYVRGQEVAKKALEIAASGGHNVLFIGQPGSGKTLLARSYPSILPKLTEEEILEVTQIYSAAGLLKQGQVLLERPFRSPHHSSSHIALVGGGSKLRPGEISLSHRGVLFLDEFPEFTRETIEALRQPLEDGEVTISRASGSVRYPSRFYLLAAANPTPSGFDPDDPESMNRPANKAAILRYQAKFSGPILDRIDIHVEVNRPKKNELQSSEIGETSKQVALRVQAARDIQTERYKNYGIKTNSEMTLPLIEKFCKLDHQGEKILAAAIDKFKLSARSYMRILKLSRTIADLESSSIIKPEHLAHSLQYRGRWVS